METVQQNIVLIFFLLSLKPLDSLSHDIYVSIITTETGPFLSSGAIPIIEFALDEINNRSDILANYTLSYSEILDSKCQSIRSVDLFMYQFLNNSHAVDHALIGCGCSVATLPVAEISHYWSIPHIDYSSTISNLKDKTIFKSFFQTVPSFHYITSSLSALASSMGWRQFAVITDTEGFFVSVTERLSELFRNNGIYIDTSVRVSSRYNTNYYNYFNWTNGTVQRIIFINTYSSLVFQILCEAYKLGMKYPVYVWITYGNYNDDWWSMDTPGCPMKHMKYMINGSLSIIPDGYYTSNASYTSTSGMTPQSFNTLYQNIMKGSLYHPVSSLSGSAYDSVWLLALGLEEAVQRIASGNDSGCESLPGSLVPLEEFDYSNKKIGCIMQECIASISFNGITGPFTLSTRDTDKILLMQYRMKNNHELVKVPVIETVHNGITNETLIHFIYSIHNIWGRVPYDGYATRRIVEYNKSSRITFVVFTSFGLILAGACFVFNTYFRKKKVIILSNPNLNIVLICGCVGLYCNIIPSLYTFTGFDETLKQSVLCNFRVWMYSVSYMLSFAVVLAKAWRVYHAYNNPNRKLKNWILYLIVLVLTLIDLLLLLIEILNPNTRISAQIIYDRQIITPNSTVEKQYFYYCHRHEVTLTLSVSYRSLLQLVGIFIAFHTRKVTIKALNESKQTGVIIYINSIFLVISGVTSFVLSRYYEVESSLTAVLSLLQPTLFLLLIFIPNMVLVYLGDEFFKDTEDDHDATNTEEERRATSYVRRQATAKLKTKIKELEGEVAKLSSHISKVSLSDIRDDENEYET